MLQPAKVSTPGTAALGLAVQVRVPVPGLVPMVRVTNEVSVATVLPPASSTATRGWVAKAVPPVPWAGGAVKRTFGAVPAATVNAAPGAVVRPVTVALRVKAPAVPWVILQPAKVATPAVA